MGVVAIRTEQGHTLVAERDELEAHLAVLVAQGRLVPEGLLAQGWTPDGRCFARVRLLDVAPRRRIRRAVIVSGVVGGGIVLTAATWAVVVAVAWVVGHLAAILFAAMLAALVMLGLGQVGICPGVHCPGCKHR